MIKKVLKNTIRKLREVIWMDEVAVKSRIW